MRNGRLKRHEQAGLHHCQAHRYQGFGEAICERAEGAEGVDDEVGQGGALGGLLWRAERVSGTEYRAGDGDHHGAR